MSIIDTHCHLDLISQQGIEINEALQLASEAGLKGLIQIATDFNSTSHNLNLSSQAPSFLKSFGIHYYWTAGLHPCSSMEFESLNKIFDIARASQQDETFIGIGETGLDYYHQEEAISKTYIQKQRDCFEAHIQLAKQLKRPLILHLRDDKNYTPEKTIAIQEAFEMIKNSGVLGVLHCFTYTHKEAKPFVELGWFVSYSGVITFNNAKAVQNGAVNLPIECLLVETDAPFLAPIPFRGKTNVPSYVRYTLDFLANLRNKEHGEDIESIKKTIYENSMRFIKHKF